MAIRLDKSNAGCAVGLSFVAVLAFYLVLHEHFYVRSGIEATINTNRIFSNLDCIGNSVKRYIEETHSIPRNAFGEVSIMTLVSRDRKQDASIQIDCFECKDGSTSMKYILSERICNDYLNYVSGIEDTSQIENIDDNVLVIYHDNNFSLGRDGSDFFVICHCQDGLNFVKEFDSIQSRDKWIGDFTGTK